MTNAISYQTKNVFPTAYIAYTINDNNTIGINYGRRIDRPNYGDLNPFRWYFNPYSYSEGNPFLKPTYSHNLEFSYSYASNLNISISYLVAQNVISQFTYLNDANTMQATRLINLSDDKALSIGVSYTFSKIKWIESNGQIQTVLNTNRALIKEANQNISIWGAAATVNNTLYLNKNKTILGNIDFEYVSNQASALGTQRYTARLDIGVRAILLNKILTLAISCTDILKSDVHVFETNSNGILNQTNNYYDLRVVRLAGTYKIGKRKNIIEQKESKIEEERNRVGL